MKRIKFSVGELNWLLSSVLEENIFNDFGIEYADNIDIRPFRECDDDLRDNIGRLFTTPRSMISCKPWERCNIARIGNRIYEAIFYNSQRNLAFRCNLHVSPQLEHILMIVRG